jgi:hypothetical protein
MRTREYRVVGQFGKTTANSSKLFGSNDLRKTLIQIILTTYSHPRTNSAKSSKNGFVISRSPVRSRRVAPEPPLAHLRLILCRDPGRSRSWISARVCPVSQDSRRVQCFSSHQPFVPTDGLRRCQKSGWQVRWRKADSFHHHFDDTGPRTSRPGRIPLCNSPWRRITCP